MSLSKKSSNFFWTCSKGSPGQEIDANTIESQNMERNRNSIGETLERFPITWNHVIDKDSLKIKELEQGLIEKVAQLFRDMLERDKPDQG